LSAGTLTALLDEITTCASSDTSDTPGLFALMWPAGTGKSAIAHIIAARFDQLKQLGSAFCFTTGAFNTRQPEDLLRNMARDLRAKHPAFKAALAKSIGGNRYLCGTADIDTRFRRFLFEPSKNVAISDTDIVTIDALDESETPSGRQHLFYMLSHQLKELPIVFNVSSLRAKKAISRLRFRSPPRLWSNKCQPPTMRSSSSKISWNKQ